MAGLEEQLVQVGCWQCGAKCPYTDETVPALTEELGEQWLQAHRRDCPYPDWPGAEQ